MMALWRRLPRRAVVALTTVVAVLALLGAVRLAGSVSIEERLSEPAPLPPDTPRRPPEERPIWTVPGLGTALTDRDGSGLRAAAGLLLVPVRSEEPNGVAAFDARRGLPRWSTPIGPGASIRAVVGGRVIVAPRDGAVSALDLHNGDELWRRRLASGQRAGNATAAGRHLFVGTGFPTEGDERAPILYALDLASGTPRWRASLRPGTELQWGAPVVAEGLVLVRDLPTVPGGGARSRLHALDAATGAVRWTADLGREVGFDGARPIVDHGTVYTVAAAGRLLALDARSGRELWTVTTGNPTSSIAGIDGPILIATTGADLVGFDARSGSRRWAVRVPPSPRSWASLDGRAVYLLADRLTAVDAANGVERWRAGAGNPVGPPVRVGGTVYVARRDSLVAYDAATGRQLWTSRRLGRSAVAAGPVAFPGGVAVVTAGGGLLVYEA
jgi:outer membrane protein assembly factor BamB